MSVEEREEVEEAGARVEEASGSECVFVLERGRVEVASVLLAGPACNDPGLIPDGVGALAEGSEGVTGLDDTVDTPSA